MFSTWATVAILLGSCLSSPGYKTGYSQKKRKRLLISGWIRMKYHNLISHDIQMLCSDYIGDLRIISKIEAKKNYKQCRKKHNKYNRYQYVNESECGMDCCYCDDSDVIENVIAHGGSPSSCTHSRVLVDQGPYHSFEDHWNHHYQSIPINDK